MIRVRIKGAHDVRVYEEDDILKPGEEEVVLSTVSNGICGSDMHRYIGSFEIMHVDWLTGHEVGGYIKEVNSKKHPELKKGMKVAVNPEFGCGSCQYCREGRQDLCEQMDFYGTMGEEIIIPADSIVPLPEDFDMRYSGMIEPAAVAARATEGLVGKNVIIIGTGSIGILQQQILTSGKGKVITLDRSDYSLEMSKRYGKCLTVKMDDVNEVMARIKEYIGEERIDCVIDNVCNDQTIAFAVEAVKRGGEVRMVGVNLGKVSFKYTDVLFKQVVLRPIHIYTKEHYELVNQYIADGVFDFAPMVSRFFALRDADKAFEYKHSVQSTKVILLTRDEDLPNE